MAVSFKYWEDCVDPDDMQAMWMDPDVSKEWIDAGEDKDEKVHLSRDPDGQAFLTQTEMKAVAEIVMLRHFPSEIDQDMVRAIAELESDRQPGLTRYNKKLKESTLGIMQILPKTAEWLVSEVGYNAYEIQGNQKLLYRPFINVYLGAAYLKWLSNFEGKERGEEFVVRAYRQGPKKATHKSTLDYWQRYQSVKQNLPSKRHFLYKHSSGFDSSVPDASASDASVPDDSTPSSPVHDDSTPTPPVLDDSTPIPSVTEKSGDEWKYWDSRASPEDMDDMWKRTPVVKEWTKSGEKRGNVRFSLDAENRPYLSRKELKAVTEVVVSKHFNDAGIKPSALSALAEVSSMRFVHGVGPCTGIMGIDYDKARWLYNDFGYNAYDVNSEEDLYNPFASAYFAAAYLVWLSQYEGRERTPQFVIQAYLAGPENVSPQELGPHWNKFEEALSHYHDRRRREQGSCSIM